jgi:DNA oxidative demethylase
MTGRYIGATLWRRNARQCSVCDKIVPAPKYGSDVRNSKQEMHISQGFRSLPGFFDQAAQTRLLEAIRCVIADAPLYVPAMPKTGKQMSVRMTNCGSLGWVTDQERGYRYQADHPVTGRPWPAIPAALLDLWSGVAGYLAPPEACLINYYAHSARMGSHRDADEQDFSAPVVSVSLGDDAVFHIGGPRRSDPKIRLTLQSGDVVVLGGDARLAYHGIDRTLPGTSVLLAEGGRFNLTLRRVTRPGA